MEPAANHFDDVTVLVVDDFDQMRLMLREYLARLGFRKIMEAKNGVTAIALLESDRIDLIISDWDMPKLDGLKLLKHVRSHDATRSIPFLMITAKPHKELVLEAIDAKVDYFLVKPFAMASLGKKVVEILRQR
jgi:two-component system chemotaxis response regulator CheY